MNPSPRLKFVLFTWLCVLTIPASTKAQLTEGSLTGTVIDSSGAPVADTQILVTNLATQETRQVTADAEGFYRVSYLAPGKYSVTAQHSGFQKAVVQGISVEPATITRADIQL